MVFVSFLYTSCYFMYTFSLTALPKSLSCLFYRTKVDYSERDSKKAKTKRV